MTGSCTVHFKRDARVYERVQPRLPEVSRCNSALFRSPKGSQYQLVQVVSDTKLSQVCCSARDLLYIIRISHCCTLFKHRCMINVGYGDPRVWFELHPLFSPVFYEAHVYTGAMCTLLMKDGASCVGVFKV